MRVKGALPKRPDLHLAHRMGMDDVLEPLQELIFDFEARGQTNDDLAGAAVMSEEAAICRAKQDTFVFVVDELRNLVRQVTEES